MSLKGEFKMKKVLALILTFCFSLSLTACGNNYDSDKVMDYVSELETAQNDTTDEKYKPDVDELEKTLPGSVYKYYTGSSNGEATITFFSDITRSGDVLKGHCRKVYDDGSDSDKVSYEYRNGMMYININTDGEIAKGYRDITVDYIVYKDYLILENSKATNVTITDENFFDAFISKYLKFSSDGTVKVKEYKEGNIVLFPEGYYSGTYTRDGNIVTCNTYCSETNYNSKWYMYIDDDGNIYSDVFVCKKADSSKSTASTSQTTTNSESNNNYIANNNNNSPSKNTPSQSYAVNSFTENTDHVCSYSIDTCADIGYCSCGATTEVIGNGHSWQKATCTKPETCIRCGETRGSDLAEHYYSINGTNCWFCGAPNPDTVTNTPNPDDVIIEYSNPLTIGAVSINVLSYDIKIDGNNLVASINYEFLTDINGYNLKAQFYDSNNENIDSTVMSFFGGYKTGDTRTWDFQLPNETKKVVVTTY